MKINGSRVLVCNCDGTMDIDGNKLAKACGANEALSISSSLFRKQIKVFENATTNCKVFVACTQQAPMFMISTIVRMGRGKSTFFLPPTKSNDKPNLENEMEFVELVLMG
jgi:hypothetical protein